VLARHVNAGQIEKVRDALPEDVRALWQESPEGPDQSAKREPQRAKGGRQS
jgi:hypothetical protein